MVEKHLTDVTPPVNERTDDFHRGRLYQLIWCLDHLCQSELTAQGRARLLVEIRRIEDEHGI